MNNLDFNQRDVLVGVAKDIKQLAANLTHRFYYTPKKSIAKTRFPIDTIALYQPLGAFGEEQSGIWYYGKVVNYEILKREHIIEILPKRNPKELYYKFIIEEWIELPKRIEPKEIAPSVNTYTNLYLLKTAEYMPELYIQTVEQFRLYFQLKRMSDRFKEEKKSQVQDFLFENNNVELRDGNIYLVDKDGSEKVFKVKEFLKRPKEIMKEIMKSLES